MNKVDIAKLLHIIIFLNLEKISQITKNFKNFNQDGLNIPLILIQAIAII